MLRDITLGQYYAVDSPIHRLDPRTKIVGTLLYIVSLFLFDNMICFALTLLLLASVIIASRVPFSFMVRGLRSIVILLIFTGILNVFLTPGETVFKIWKITATKEGIKLAIFMIIRLILLIIGSSVMTLTTTPSALTDGLEKLMRPLRLIKVPVHEIAMMMSIALSFIPILVEETNKIMKAQMARGADFESGNIVRRAKAMIPILVPLFVSAFRRANELSYAMESRCYRGGEGRTKMKPLSYKKNDAVAYLLMILYLAGIIALNSVTKGLLG